MKAVFEAFARPAVADHTILPSMDTCVKFVEACKPKYVGMCLDPRQQYREEKSFESLKSVGKNRQLFPYVQLNDQADASGPTGTIGVLPGDGFVPLHDYLDALPDDIDISVEAQMSPGVYTSAEWCKVSVERIRRYLDRHYARASVA